jgi:hypothetical protein
MAAMDTDLARRLDRLPVLVNEDAALVQRGRFVRLAFGLGLGDSPYAVVIEAGRIAAVEPGPFLLRPLAFLINGSEAGWRGFWAPLPPPHHHDIFALAKLGAFRIEGELLPLMQNLLYFKAVLAAPRAA